MELSFQAALVSPHVMTSFSDQFPHSTEYMTPGSFLLTPRNSPGPSVQNISEKASE